jgi:topoisomerase IV subunit A
MDDFKQLMQHHYIKYASYVILDRAIPNVVDGLKPVQRRILQTLWDMHDGKLHKVANIAGQTMALHPHGDAPITDALINIANKGFLLDMQGNFGNIYTGDPAAAARYIESRLSPLALETMFNPDLTETISSYDSRRKEPVCLPAKIPLILMQGADGIAVGMSTHILPHNFIELLEAEIAVLEDREFTILPDFPTGGIMDASQYEKGKGKIKLRAKMEERDPKTIVITEVCYGTTTESLIRSIDEAAKRGKIKIEAINDYTSDKVEIEIKLPRGIYASEMIKALYGYTECEVTLHSQIVLIKDSFPWEPDVDEILRFHVKKLQSYLQKELEIERDRLLNRIFDKTLEQIFIENRLYKLIENVASNDKIHSTVATSLTPFHPQLLRIPDVEDREKLLNIPIRRISKFDIEKNLEEIAATQVLLDKIDKDLKNVKKFTITYLRNLIKKYHLDYTRKTQIQAIEQIDMREIDKRILRVGFDSVTGFIGTKVTGPHVLECTNYDKLLLMFNDGSYSVINIPEKQYVGQNGNHVVFAGVADKKSIFSVVYRDPKNYLYYAKRFIIKQFILDKSYRYFEEEMELQLISTENQIQLELQLIPKPKQKVSKIQVGMEQVLVKSVSAKANRLSNRPVKKFVLIKK